MAAQVEHVVIIVKENHSFDNYVGTFRGADGAQLAQAQNPPPDDPNHRHEAWMARKRDTAHMVQYLRTDIPGYFDYAERYTLCDKYFSEVAGPSTPNHLMLICAAAPTGQPLPRSLRAPRAERQFADRVLGLRRRAP